MRCIDVTSTLDHLSTCEGFELDVHRRDEQSHDGHGADDPLSTGRCPIDDRGAGPGRNAFTHQGLGVQGWSTYGAKRAQPVATRGKCEGLENSSNKPIGNPWQPTATVPERMVKSVFATACHQLPTIPYLVREGVDLLASQRIVATRAAEARRARPER